jgi:hypothetical protein
MATSTFPNHKQLDWSGNSLIVDEVATDNLVLDTLSVGGVAAGNYVVKAAEVTYTETAGAGAYLASVVVPAGSWLLDVVVHGVALWDNAGAVDMDVGFAGGTEIFDITSLKSGGDLVAGESISFGTGSDGGEGGSTASTNYARYSATSRTITGEITSASTGGSTGRTRMLVLWAEPITGAVSVAAVKT